MTITETGVNSFAAISLAVAILAFAVTVASFDEGPSLFALVSSLVCLAAFATALLLAGYPLFN